MTLLGNLVNYAEKEIGLKSKMEPSYTNEYDYSKEIPKPCNYINLKTKECCDSESFKSNKDCVECNYSLQQKGICNYVWDYNFNKDDAINSTDDFSLKRKKNKIWFTDMLKTSDSIKDSIDNTGYEDILFGNPKNRLGSRYFYKNGLKCKNEYGRSVDAYNYTNNIIPKNINVANSVLNDISNLSIDEIINSGAVDNKHSKGKKGGGLLREYECTMVTRPIGISVDNDSRDCKKDINILSDTRCIYDTKPTISGS